MSCEDAREWFSAWLDDALDAGDRARLDAHLAGCPECRRELDRLRQTVALLRTMDAPLAPAGFVDRVRAAASPPPGPSRAGGGAVRGARADRAPVRAGGGRWRLLRERVPLSAAALVVGATLAVYVFQNTPTLQRAARYEPAPPPSEQELAAGGTGSADLSARSDRTLSVSPRSLESPPAVTSMEELRSKMARPGPSSEVSRDAPAPLQAPPADTGPVGVPRGLFRGERDPASSPGPQAVAPSPESPHEAASRLRSRSLPREVQSLGRAPTSEGSPATDASKAADPGSAPPKDNPREAAERPPFADTQGRSERPLFTHSGDATSGPEQGGPRLELAPPRPESPTSGTEPPPARPSPSVSATRLAPPPGVRGRLVVKNAQEAEREVVRIAAGVGGVEIRRQSGDDGAITIHLVVPEPRYAEFSSALATVGHWQRDEEPADLPARVTVTVRITR